MTTVYVPYINQANQGLNPCDIATFTSFIVADHGAIFGITPNTHDNMAASLIKLSSCAKFHINSPTMNDMNGPARAMMTILLVWQC
jgi:hypothetical protein